MTHAPLDALHTPTGRLVQVCTTCETDDGDWVLWPCAVVLESRACVSAGQTGCGGVTEGADRTRMEGVSDPRDAPTSGGLAEQHFEECST